MLHAGTRHAIRRIKVVNATTTTNQSFLIDIDAGPNNGPSDRNVIEDCCEISNIKGGSCRGISLTGTTSNPISGMIRNNQIFLSDIETSGTDDQDAIGGTCVVNSLIEGNYVAGAKLGYLLTELYEFNNQP